MIKKSTLLLFLLIFGAFGYLAAQNQPSDQPTSPSQQEPYQQDPATDVQKTTEIKGTVDKIDLAKKTIAIKDEVTKESKEYTFNDSTSFSKEEKVMKAEDLKKGDKVLLHLDSQNMVVKVNWEPAESTAPETEKPEKQD